MIIDEKGKVIFEVGDVVVLPTVRPINWNKDGEMDNFLGQTVKILRINGETFQHDAEGSLNWAFKLKELPTDFVTPEMIEEAKLRKQKEEEEKAERIKSFLTTPEQIYNVAKDVFGEERVDLVPASYGSDGYFKIVVYFPEITIKNSKRQSHTIKELYVRFSIKVNLTELVPSCNLYVSGTRTLMSDKEYMCDYAHSHLPSGATVGWESFCLGNSDFSMLVNTLRISMTPEDWFLLFFSLENYVSWESLEGGPYRSIANIGISRSSTNRDAHIPTALDLIPDIPKECLTFNDGNVELIEDHPSLYTYYDTNSPLKSFTSTRVNFTSTLTGFRSRLSRLQNPFVFKGTVIERNLYPSNAEEAALQIDPEVIAFLNQTIKREIKKFNLSYEYNKNRSGAFLREAITF